MRKLLPVWLCLSLFTSLPVFSTTVEKFTLDDLVQKSGRIIVGKCISRESRWNDRNTLILTTARFLVSEPLKGSSDGFVNVVTVGGTLDGITQTVSGMPVFEPEEEVLLFLARRYLELLAETDPAQKLEREMTERLIDLVLYRLHGLPVDGFDPFALSRFDDD